MRTVTYICDKCGEKIEKENCYGKKEPMIHFARHDPRLHAEGAKKEKYRPHILVHSVEWEIFKVINTLKHDETCTLLHIRRLDGISFSIQIDKHGSGHHFCLKCARELIIETMLEATALFGLPSIMSKDFPYDPIKEKLEEAIDTMEKLAEKRMGNEFKPVKKAKSKKKVSKKKKTVKK